MRLLNDNHECVLQAVCIALKPYLEITMKLCRRVIAVTLITSMCAMSVPMSSYASMISTEDAIVSAHGEQDRAKVDQFFQREDVQKALQEKGISYESAKARIDAMSDAEVASLADRVDEAPAGGDVLGVAFAVFVILLITDILGLTKVFPFTRSVR